MNEPFIRQALREIKTMPVTWFPDFFTKGWKMPRYETTLHVYLDNAGSQIRLDILPHTVRSFSMWIPYRPPKEQLRSVAEAHKWLASQLLLLKGAYQDMIVKQWQEERNDWSFIGWEERPYEGEAGRVAG